MTTPIADQPVNPDEAREANRRNWDDRAPIHAGSDTYGLDRYRSDPSRISTVVADDMEILAPHLPGGSVEGLDTVHLQCHIGTDTISLERLGATGVTGVDFSGESLAVARSLAEQTGAKATFVQSEVTEADRALDRTFDLVYTGTGAICWLPDLDPWARTVAALLRPGGAFYIRDGHPMLSTIDFDRTDELVARYRYFPNGNAEAWDDEATYTDGDASTISNTRTYAWPHSLGEVITALLDAGLTLVAFGEHRTCPWKALPMMTAQGDRWVLPETLRDSVPLTFSIVARKR